MLTAGKQDFRVVGYLNSIEDITINQSGAAFIKLTTLSDLPESIDVNDFHGEINVYVSKFTMISLYDNPYDADDVRVQHIWNELSSLLIEVTPDVKSDRDRPNKYWWWGDRIRVQKLNESFHPSKDVKLVSMPVFSKENSATGIETASDFEDAIKSNKLLGKLKAEWSRDKFDVPAAVIWKTDDFDLTVYTGIDQQTHTKYGTMYILEAEKAKKISLTEEDASWFNAQYQFDDVVYIPSDIAFEQYLSKAVLLSTAIAADSSLHDEKVVSSGVSSSMESNLSIVSEQVIAEKKSEESSDAAEQSKDAELLIRFKENTRQKGLYYADSDLVNFHVSMKTDGMVILSGLSGTGKSKLVTEYANALQISSGDNGSRSQVRFVSVRPFWADDSDLLGYADTVNNIYRPGDSGLIDTLIDAQDNPDDLFIVVFDEMNLARVEHYFSQFLSVLEMDAGTRRLALYNEQLESRLYNSEKYPANITIGENVLFVGTVNTDESTYQFSDKVLDRSNVMTLEMIPFGSVDELTGNPIERGKREAVKASDFQKMKKVNTDAQLTSGEKNMLWELHQAINAVDANIGIGWRIVKQIDKYLMNLPVGIDSFTREKALDTQIMQRVLTKVRGSEEQMSGLVGQVNVDGAHESGQLETILDRYSDSSLFEGSREIITRKAKELKLYGFTV